MTKHPLFLILIVLLIIGVAVWAFKSLSKRPKVTPNLEVPSIRTKSKISQKTLILILIGVVAILIVGYVGFKYFSKTNKLNLTGAGQIITQNPITASHSGFPSIQTSYMSPRTINPGAVSYQMADYDSKHNQVLFYPYGSITDPLQNSGILLTYNVASNDFTNPSSWKATDLTQVVSPTAMNFGGGFIDDQSNFAYLPADHKEVNGKLTANGTALKIDLAKQSANPSDKSAYQTFDISTLPEIPEYGGFDGIYGNGYAYYAPTVSFKTGDFHGIFVRYNSNKSFTDPNAWQWYNLNNISTPPDHDLGGMQSMAFKAPFVYLIPFANGSVAPRGQKTMASKLVRFDTTAQGGFESSSSYQTLDLTTLPFPSEIQQKLKGFTGGVVVNNQLILIPWGFRNTEQTESVALMFDTTKKLSDSSAWQYIDLTTVDPKAGGYQFGWVDKDSFVWFVPTHNFTLKTRPMVPPFVVWNSKLPFNTASSWTSYPTPGPIWSTGAAYDPNTNTAWLSPYGTSANLTPGITQIKETY